VEEAAKMIISAGLVVPEPVAKKRIADAPAKEISEAAE